MNKLIKFLRIALGLLVAALLTLGITAISRTASGGDAAIGLAVLALVFILPAILYSLSLLHHASLFPNADASISSSGNGGTNSFPAVYSFVVCSLFWLGWLVLALSDPGPEGVKQIAIAFIVTLMVIVVVHVFVVAHLGPTPQPLPTSAYKSDGVKQGVLRVVRGTDRLLRLGGRLLWAPLLLGLGSAMVLAGPLAFGASYQDYKSLISGRWITAEYGLSDHLTILRPVVDVLGHGLYAGSMLLAVVSLVCIFCKLFKPTARLVSHAQSKIAWAAGILCVYSILDLYFGWIGYRPGEFANQVWLWSVFGLAVFYCGILVALAVTAMTSRGSKVPGHASFLPVAIALFAPLLCADAVNVTPFLTDGFIDLRGFAMIYLGIQFLCWGWVQMAVPHTR